MGRRDRVELTLNVKCFIGSGRDSQKLSYDSGVIHECIGNNMAGKNVFVNAKPSAFRIVATILLSSS